MRGNFETWNLQMRSFAASDGGYDLLLTPKDKRDPNPASNKYELLHPNQFQIVAQRLKSPYFRKYQTKNWLGGWKTQF